MRINLGSNDVLREGYLNVDIRDIPEVDIVDDFTTLKNIEDNSVEEMLCHNIFHIIATDKMESILRLWISKLEDGGVIEIGVPDGELIFCRYVKNHDWEELSHSIFGGIKFLRQWHGEDAEKYSAHNIFCEKSLREIMKKVGLKDIEITTQNHPDNITLRGKNMARIDVREYPINLDIGCGKQCEEGYETGLDMQDFGQAIVWDVRNGIPLPDKSVQKIHSSHFFEHLTYAELQPLMQEIRRVLRGDCTIQIYVPHMETCDGAYDYAHRTFWNEQRVRGFFTRLDYEILSMERISEGQTLKAVMKILPLS